MQPDQPNQTKWRVVYNPILGQYFIYKLNKRTRIYCRNNPTLLNAYVSQLNILNPEMLEILNEGWYRIYFPQIGPAGFLPNAFMFDGYVSPYDGLPYDGLENKFFDIDHLHRFYDKYPNIISLLTNSIITKYSPIPHFIHADKLITD